jgi:hypothetical protein
MRIGLALLFAGGAGNSAGLYRSAVRSRLAFALRDLIQINKGYSGRSYPDGAVMSPATAREHHCALRLMAMAIGTVAGMGGNA